MHAIFSRMAAPNLDDLLALDVASRLSLIAKLWDSIVDDSHALPLADSERELLERRLKEDDNDPDAAIPWELARAELLPPR
jgi:putative addiction module component (TIGR02574 family)